MQAQIIDLLLRLREERRLSILLITHDLGVVAELAHRVAVLYAGQIVESTEVKTLFRRPLHPYTRALLSAVPRLDGDGGRRLATIEGAVPDPTRYPPGCRFAPRCPTRSRPAGSARSWPSSSRGTGCGAGCALTSSPSERRDALHPSLTLRALIGE